MREAINKWLPPAVLVGLVVLGILFWRASIEAAEDRALLRTTLAEMEKRQNARAEQTAADNRAIDTQVAQAGSPGEMARLIGELARLRQPPTIVTVPTAPPHETMTGAPETTPATHETPPGVHAALPDAPKPQPGDMVTAAAEVPTLLGALAEGRKCANSLATCNADKAELKQALDTTVKVATGGSRWRKVGRVLLHAGCAAAGGSAGAAIDPNRQRGAAIGAGAGIVGCATFGR